MDHDRLLHVALVALVLQLESLGQIKIALDGAALPCPSNRILNFQVDLGPVERPSPLVDLVVPALSFQCAFQRICAATSEEGARRIINIYIFFS